MKKFKIGDYVLFRDKEYIIYKINILGILWGVSTNEELNEEYQKNLGRDYRLWFHKSEVTHSRFTQKWRNKRCQ